MVLNPQRKHYEKLKQVIKQDYEDLVWGEDAIFLERNSRTFRERILKINESAEELCDFLSKSPKGKFDNYLFLLYLASIVNENVF